MRNYRDARKAGYRQCVFRASRWKYIGFIKFGEPVIAGTHAYDWVL